MLDTKTYYCETFKHVQSQLPGNKIEWLKTQRNQAIEAFEKIGLPNRKVEDWKYTSVAGLEKITLNAKHDHAEPSDTKQNLLLNPDECYSITLINGVYQASSNHNTLPKGLTILSLAEALNSHSDKLAPYLGKYINADTESFAALNTAFMQDGVCLFLEKNCQLDKPILIHYLTDCSGANPHIRNIIIADELARAEIIEHFQTNTDEAYFTNAITELHLKQQSTITHYKIIQESLKSYHISDTVGQIDKDGHLNSHVYTFSGGLVRADTNLNLNEPGAYAGFIGLYLADEQSHVDHHTRALHLKPHGRSNEYYKGIIAGRARAVFNGKVYVAKHAQKTNASQQNKNILLSKQAQVNTKPQLEIYADDVKCAHGATVGQLSDEALFYLQSRGVGKYQAQRLLTHAFAQDILDEINCQTLKSALENILTKKLERMTMNNNCE